MAIAVTVLVIVMIGSIVTLAVMIRDNRATPSGSTAEQRSAPTTTTVPPPTTTTTGPPRRYVVQSGDSLSGIASRFGVSVVRLATVNAIVDVNRIAPGQVLRIPRVRLVIDPVTVAAGESISARLTGAGPSETVAFEVAWPSGSYTGAPHVASPEGVVTASYRTAADDPVGSYTVTGRGGQGTRVEAMFVVEPPVG